MKVHNVILSGGVGSRLWPLSRKANPKQFLKLIDGKSLFELTAERNMRFVQEIIVVGNSMNIELSKNLLCNIPTPKRFITETYSRNTAAAVLYSALAVEEDDILIVTPSDHLIDDKEAYKTAVERAISLAQQDYIITFGIVPTKAEVGFGYIEHVGEDVITFREKPDLVTAQNFVKEGRFLWNSGIFCFKSGVYKKELSKYQPKLYEKAYTAWLNGVNGRVNADLSESIPSISIDYAVMEKSERIKVVCGGFIWDDLGSYEALYNYYVSKGYAVDQNGNMVIGENVPFTSFAGLANVIFVSTPTANLILQKENSQEVKIIYDNLLLSAPHLK